MSEIEITKPNPIYKILIMILPIGVVVGTAIFMYMYFHLEREEAKEHSVLVAREMKVSELESLVDKFTNRIGLRDIDSEQGRAGLHRAASMIEGGLGPQNLGLTVTKGEGVAAHGKLWRSLSVDIRGVVRPEEVIVASVSYSGNGELADGNTVSTVMMLASAMARDKPARTIRFVFEPLVVADVGELKERAGLVLKDDEKLAGVIALDTMQGMPDLLDAGWVSLVSKSAIDIEQGSELLLTHSVYSSETWKDNEDGRLAATLNVAKQLRNRLLKMASE